MAAGVIDKNYQFQLSTMSDLDQQNKLIKLDPILDEQGKILIPHREINYDYLVLAIGTPGVTENAYFLDSLAQAERFHKALLNQLLRINQQTDLFSTLKVAIVGAGATGTELAAQLHHVANLARSYGMPRMSSKRLVISIIEAGDHILPAYPERIATSARGALTKLGIKVLEGTRITKSQKEGFVTNDEVLIEADSLV